MRIDMHQFECIILEIFHEIWILRWMRVIESKTPGQRPGAGICLAIVVLPASVQWKPKSDRHHVSGVLEVERFDRSAVSTPRKRSETA